MKNNLCIHHKFEDRMEKYIQKITIWCYHVCHVVIKMIPRNKFFINYLPGASLLARFAFKKLPGIPDYHEMGNYIITSLSCTLDKDI